ncbi:MAG TPA: tellurite resistance/C4-dicarboxylate transporter family protein [Syntrophales bacterium]|nr:tellurite resistance/C4-dicarboxylate transporter family protein [Syntrophales bacterium]
MTKVKTIVFDAVRDFYPGYFALVMATGIVSISANLLDMAIFAALLFYINISAYCFLVLLTAVRLFRYFPRVWMDLTDHQSGPGFFTIIAGTCVLGSQFAILTGNIHVGFYFWITGACLWLIIMYSFFAAVIIRPVKPSIEKGLHGGWLVTVVSTQSLSVLGILSAGFISTNERVMLFFALAFYLLGCAMYLALIALILYRLLFFTLTPETFTPPYWVNMGTIAITTLAGSLLIQKAPAGPFLTEILPFLRGFTFFFWVAASWWIPLLVILEFWRHIWKRFPILYDPEYWNIVFPLGMYSAATFELERATSYAFLGTASRGMLYLVLTAWLIVFIGLLRDLWGEF